MIGSKKMGSFKDLRVVDNFYQSSSFFPMPTILISTLCEDGQTSLGAYSLCFPYYVAGKSYYAMLLVCRNSSNTAQNILRSKKCALNFLPDSKKYFKETVRLGFPGETTKEKMEKTIFTFEEGLLALEKKEQRPLLISEAIQVFECSWDDSLDQAYEDISKLGKLEGIDPPYRDFNGITSKFGAHFILKIDKVLIKEKYYDAICQGVTSKGFPKMPVDYGYRDSKYFWYMKGNKPIKMPIPEKKGMDLSSVRYAADRIDPNIYFTDEACQRLIKIPRVFLKAALLGIVEQAKTMDLKIIDGKRIICEQTVIMINQKRRK
jgi:flavin reductase (DIM6/NTAB) family NADH-FMN oxidoreductase RutF